MARFAALSMALAMLCVAPPPVVAGPADGTAMLASAAEDAFIRGAFEEARALGEASGDVDDLVIAARALNALAYFETDRKAARDWANSALDIAEKAVDLRPDLVEAHLQVAISFSLRGANMAPVEAIFLNIPHRARAAIDRALEIEPENPYALSTSAAWRIEVARRGGGAVFGADAELGYEEFL